MQLDMSVLSGILDASPLAIIYVDARGIIRYWNRETEALLGYRADEVVGASLDIIIPERLREAHWRGFNRAIASGETTLGERFTRTKAIHESGDNVYVEMLFKLIAHDHRPPGAVAFCRAAAPVIKENAAAARPV